MPSRYGGDFGDDPNDGNFVIDGLAVPRPAAVPGAGRTGQVQQPVDIALLGPEGKLEVRNRYDFLVALSPGRQLVAVRLTGVLAAERGPGASFGRARIDPDGRGRPAARREGRSGARCLVAGQVGLSVGAGRPRGGVGAVRPPAQL